MCLYYNYITHTHHTQVLSNGRLLVGGGDGSLTLLSNDLMWRDMRPFTQVCVHATVCMQGCVCTRPSACRGVCLLVCTYSTHLSDTTMTACGPSHIVILFCCGPRLGLAVLLVRPALCCAAVRGRPQPHTTASPTLGARQHLHHAAAHPRAHSSPVPPPPS